MNVLGTNDCWRIDLYLRSKIIFLLALFSLSLSGGLSQSNRTFVAGIVEAGPGEKATGSLLVDQATFIPITIINGVKPGPTLTINAGTHGTEYIPVLTLQELAQEITPESLSGTLILIHIANMPSFSNRNVYYSPLDNKNLNRIFPGDKEGTVSERIAYCLSDKIFSQSEYFIDLHGGEFNERLINFIYFYYGCTDNDICKKSSLLAHAMGNKYLIPYKYNTVPDTLKSMFADLEAFRRGAVSIAVEWGDRGDVAPEKVRLAKNGLINVMRTIGMLDGEIYTNKQPVYLVNETSINSQYDGILYSKVDAGEYISKGSLIAYTTDYWGKVLEKYYSPISGLVVTIVVTPAIKKGEKICVVAEAVDHFDQ